MDTDKLDSPPDKPLKIEIPSRAMAFSAARNLGLSVDGVNGDTVELVIKTTITTQLRLDPSGRPFVTIQFGGQWRDVYIELPQKAEGVAMADSAIFWVAFVGVLFVGLAALKLVMWLERRYGR